jgi:hypothetical protein
MAPVQLKEFFAVYSALPWQPGKVDCLLMLADYAVALGYSDPAAHLRGTYDSDEGFERIIEWAGNVPALVGDCAGRINAKLVQRPFCGAIGVIGSSSDIHRQFGAIHDGERWNIRFKEKIAPMVARPLAIWII